MYFVVPKLVWSYSTTSSTIHVREASELCVLPQWYSVVQEPPRYCWVLRRCISKLCLPSVLWIFPFVYHGLWVFIVPPSFCSTCIMVWCANLISHYSVSTNLTFLRWSSELALQVTDFSLLQVSALLWTFMAVISSTVENTLCLSIIQTEWINPLISWLKDCVWIVSVHANELKACV